MRLFVAVDLEENIKDRLAKFIESLKKEDLDVRWVKTGSLHITLKFLGEVGEESVKEIVKRIESSVKGVNTFRMSVQGIGYFGSPNFIRTLWAGVGKGEKELTRIALEMNEALDYVKKDSHAPNAHITIGRVKSGRNNKLLLERLENVKDVKFGEMDVKLVKLKQSILVKNGPIYIDHKVFNLG